MPSRCASLIGIGVPSQLHRYHTRHYTHGTIPANTLATPPAGTPSRHPSTNVSQRMHPLAVTTSHTTGAYSFSHARANTGCSLPAIPHIFGNNNQLTHSHMALKRRYLQPLDLAPGIEPPTIINTCQMSGCGLSLRFQAANNQLESSQYALRQD